MIEITLDGENITLPGKLDFRGLKKGEVEKIAKDVLHKAIRLTNEAMSDD